MTEQYCEKEPETAAAVFGDACDTAVLDHARNCPVCADALLVGQFLREGAQLAAHEVNSLPDATVIWRKAQALLRHKALLRATLPIRIARIAAFFVGALAAPLLILQSRWLWHGALPAWQGGALSPLPPWTAGLNASLLMLTVTGAIVLIGAGSWYMLREE